VTDKMPESSPETPGKLPGVHPKHRAYDAFGKNALQAAHDITRALAEAGEDDDGAVVLRTDGPRHKLADLEKLIDDALEEADESPDPPSG
jgi:hypothetical protein